MIRCFQVSRPPSHGLKCPIPTELVQCLETATEDRGRCPTREHHGQRRPPWHHPTGNMTQPYTRHSSCPKVQAFQSQRQHQCPWMTPLTIGKLSPLSAVRAQGQQACPGHACYSPAWATPITRPEPGRGRASFSSDRTLFIQLVSSKNHVSSRSGEIFPQIRQD